MTHLLARSVRVKNLLMYQQLILRWPGLSPSFFSDIHVLSSAEDKSEGGRCTKADIDISTTPAPFSTPSDVENGSTFPHRRIHFACSIYELSSCRSQNL
ncbi:hypothetical protein MPTK2_1g21740 [Marchantia polymorpha subsp. ruderalis]